MHSPEKLYQSESRCFRFGSSTTTLILVVAIFTLVGGISIYFIGGDEGPDLDLPVTVEVKQGEFIVEVLDQGVVESSKNVAILCEVESKDWQGIAVLEVVPEGTFVKSGDVVVRFDSTALRMELEQQELAVNTSDAKLAEAKSTLDAANEEREEYFGKSGIFERDRRKILNQKLEAEEQLTQAQEYYKHSLLLNARGYQTSLQLRSDEVALEKARNALLLAEAELNLLVVHTHKKKKIELDSKIYSAEKGLENAQRSHEIELEKRIRIKEQIEKCVVTVPDGQEGQVVYPDRMDYRNNRKFVLEPGAQVREKETLVLLPDPNFMQIKATVNESRIVDIEIGQSVTIKVDALHDQELTGKVTKVNQYAEEEGWTGGGINKYGVEVAIDSPPKEIRPGMNASISVLVHNLPSAVHVPIHAVFEQESQTYALVHADDGWETRSVKLGASNDKMIHVVEGLEKGEQIALNPRGYRGLLDLPPESE